MRLIDADALLENYKLKDATKYGNRDAEQQAHSYSTLMMYEIADMIEDAPTIQAVPMEQVEKLIIDKLAEEYNKGWIPGSEEPLEEGCYIVAWVPQGLEVRCDSPHYYGLFVYENGDWSIDVPNGFEKVGIIILAWRPLPAPYQPKGE